MSVNKERPFLWVLPEDDAVRQIAVGFEQEVYHRQLQVLPEVGGWPRMRDSLRDVYAKLLQRYTAAHLMLLFDFDGRQDRHEQVMEHLPESLMGRVFYLGASTEPEDLRRALKLSYETIGIRAAEDCRRDEWSEMWQHELLCHNQEQLERAAGALRPILFPQPT